MLDNVDIEETIFQKNVPGKYSRWEGEQDDLRNEHDPGDQGDEEVTEDPFANIPAGENVDLVQRLQHSSLPEDIKASIMSERVQGHMTGSKAVLADHKAIKALERAEREQNVQKRQEIIDRIVNGAKAANHIAEAEAGLLDDQDEDDDDDEFLALYRAKRLQELKCASAPPVFGEVRELDAAHFTGEVECVDPRTVVVVHLYEPGVQASVRMNRFLDELAVARRTIKFLRMNASMNEVEVDRVALPVLSVYRGGEVLEVIAGLTVDCGDFFALHDVEHALDRVLDHH